MRNVLVILSVFFVQFSIAQQFVNVDFKTASAKLQINLDSASVSGSIGYTFNVLNKVDTLKIDARNMHISNVILNKKLVDFKYDNNQIKIINQLNPSVDNTILISYSTQPKQTLYFLKKESHFNVWSQGQGKYTSHWLPSFDDVNEKVIFNFIFTVDSNYELISNGNLTSKIAGNNGKTDYFYQMRNPMSSYLVALAIGKYYKKTEISASGIPLELYYYTDDSLKVEPTYRYTKDIFNFLEEEIGVRYPWEIHRQVPVHDFLYAGMENTTLTIFSDSYMVDDREFNDKNYVNVNAHELAHHWFGNLVTAQSSQHHWMQEGFSTYYALLAERHVFGDDYYYWRLYEYANQLNAQQQSGSATALLDAKASSLTFYQKGAVVLYLLRKKIGGQAFKNAVANYLTKHSFASAITSDFIKEAEAESGVTLSSFVSKWLEENSFDYDAVLNELKDDSALISDYEMIDCELFQSKCKDYVTMPLHPKIKSKLLAQLPHLINEHHFNETAEVRQTIASRLTNISEELRPKFESLLQDSSYITIENALYNLWTQFPERRSKYLDSVEHIEGNNQKNVRLLWLALAIVTPEYKEFEKQLFVNELINYTSKDFNFEIRQSAFNYLQMLNLWNNTALNNLVEASKHFNWRFRSYAKELVAQLSVNLEMKNYFDNHKN